jgi:hypothetical protein
MTEDGARVRVRVCVLSTEYKTRNVCAKYSHIDREWNCDSKGMEDARILILIYVGK